MIASHVSNTFFISSLNEEKENICKTFLKSKKKIILNTSDKIFFSFLKEKMLRQTSNILITILGKKGIKRHTVSRSQWFDNVDWISIPQASKNVFF